MPSNDILVAFIEEKMGIRKLEEKICIHKYLQKCNTNPQPPGFADYLRGTIALYNLSKKYDYSLFISDDHPLFQFIRKNKNIVSSHSQEIIELLPPLNYSVIYKNLNNLFDNGSSFTVMTNSFYNLNNEILSNWGDISNDCRSYLIDVFYPSIELENKIEYVLTSIYNIKKGDEFKIIHLRFGDNFLHNSNNYDDLLYNIYYNKIINLINTNTNIKYILLSDSSSIANKLKNNIENLYYWDNNKIHIGDLRNNTNSALSDTLTDFFILSKSNEIISNGSGFSTVVSEIYKIKYTYL